MLSAVYGINTGIITFLFLHGECDDTHIIYINVLIFRDPTYSESCEGTQVASFSNWGMNLILATFLFKPFTLFLLDLDCFHLMLCFCMKYIHLNSMDIFFSSL